MYNWCLNSRKLLKTLNNQREKMSKHVNIRTSKTICMPIKIGVQIYATYTICWTLFCSLPTTFSAIFNGSRLILADCFDNSCCSIHAYVNHLYIFWLKYLTNTLDIKHQCHYLTAAFLTLTMSFESYHTFLWTKINP